MSIILPERIGKYLSACSPAVSGQHGHDALFKACAVLTWGFGLSIEEAWPFLLEFNQRCEPPWRHRDLHRKLLQALNHPGHQKPRGHLLGENVSNRSVLPISYCLPKPEPNWLVPDLNAIDAIGSAGPWLYDLWEQSPVRYDDGDSHSEQIIDYLFPGNLLLCIGKSNYEFATRSRDVWRGKLSELPLIVPNPMLTVRGRTQAGNLSEHSKEATARRAYQVIEFDFSEKDKNGNLTRWSELIPKWRNSGIELVDACAALILHLREQLPTLVCATFSGGKSLHAWFRVCHLRPAHRLEFMRKAVSLGADPATWVRSQFVRIPDGKRADGRRQTCYFLDPREAIEV